MTSKDFLDNLFGTLPLQRGSGGKLNVADVGLILGACLGLKNNTLIPSTKHKNNDTSSLSSSSINFNYNGNSLSVRNEISLAVIKFCVWDERESFIHPNTFSDFLCVLCPYRTLQKKLQVRYFLNKIISNVLLSLCFIYLFIQIGRASCRERV